MYSTQSGEWRALLKGEPVDPAAAFAYMQRAFRQTMPHVLGAMYLLAETYSPPALNERGFGLYADFRPEVDAWDKRSEMRCSKILSLRRKVETKKEEHDAPKKEDLANESNTEQQPQQEPNSKKLKVMSVEEYEAMLDAENDYLDFNGDF